tara:strand:+ start:304 stop:618 length:315 start_codon:yes stop_codon:yes gene_type:complete
VKHKEWRIMMNEHESDVERHFTILAKEYGCLTYKWPAQYHKGLPDRILICPNGHIWFVEIKKTGGVLSEMQKHVHDILRNHTASVATLYGKGDVNGFFENLPPA